MSQHYHIVGLQAENVKRIKAVRINPEGNIVEISGENGQGKSSILDSIAYALGGKDMIDDMPVRLGEKKAQVILELNGIIVKRTMTAQEDGTYTTSLVVETAEGMTAKKPQDFLNALIGELSFDPLAFVSMEPKKQFDLLKSFVPDFDFAACAKRRKAVFDERALVNRQIKEGQGAVASTPIPADVPEAEVDTSAIMEELDAVGEFNTNIERRKANRERELADAAQKVQSADEKRRYATDLRRRADQLDQDAADLIADATAMRDKVSEAGPLPDPKDSAEVRARYDEALRINEQVRRKKALDAKIAEVNALKAKSEQLSKDIDAIDKEKADAIASAKIPVEGIGFGDETVTLDGVPFSQASTAQQLRTAVALTIAKNPRLRVILIREGSMLDRKAFKMLSDMAVENDLQIFIEVVESSRPGALIIEDGEIKQAEMLEAAE
jgi:predicted ATP-dependent endonuclease of OLD family